MNDINVVELVGHAINRQSGQDLADLREKQARAAIEALSSVFLKAIDSDDGFNPDGKTVLHLMQLIARTPSDCFP